MTKYPLFFIVSYIMLLALAAAGESLPQNLQISISYWNDNYSYQEQLKNLIPPGDDDFMTASFRLEVAAGDAADWRGLEVYYALFTNRQEGNRFDMLAARWFREFQVGKWTSKYGAGGLLRGSLGGGRIQNLYHSFRGYDAVDLPYLDEWRVGIILYGRLARTIASYKDTNLQFYSSSVLRIGAGPTNIRMGFESETQKAGVWLPIDWSLILRLGYANYLFSRDIIKPYFSQGLVAGIFWGAQLTDSFGLSLWFTENQYGLQDPHTGITLSYRPHEIRTPKLHSVMFP